MGLTSSLGLFEAGRRQTIAATDEAAEQMKRLRRQADEATRLKKADLEALALLNQETRRRAGRTGRRDPTLLTGPSGVLGNPTGGGKTLLGL